MSSRSVRPRSYPRPVQWLYSLYVFLGPAKIVPGSDLRCLCLVRPAESAVLEPLNFASCRYNVKASLQVVNRFLLMPSSISTAKFAQGGQLFARMKLNADISEDTSHGRLILQNVSTVYLAPYDENNPEREPDIVSKTLRSYL